MFVYECVQLALAHHCIGKVQAVELNLSWTIVAQIVCCIVLLLEEVDKLIVQRTMGYKLQGTDRVGYTFKVVALSVGKVVHRIAVPLGACTVVWSLDNTIDDRVAEVHVGIGHIEFGTQHHASFYRLGSVHLLEECKAFLYRAVTIRACCTGSGRSSLLFCNLFRSLLVDVGMSVLDHPDGKIPQLLKIVGSIVDFAPLEAEPLYVLQDVFYVFVVLLAGVCIVKTKVADTVIFLCHTKVHADSFGVSDMQISVRLWGKACLYATVVLALLEIFFYKLFYERDAFLLFVQIFFIYCHISMRYVLYI